MSEFGDALRSIRKSKRISQEALALKIGMDRGHLSKIEGGRISMPTDDVVERIAKGLELAPEELYRAAGIFNDPNVDTRNPIQLRAELIAKLLSVRLTENRVNKLETTLDRWIRFDRKPRGGVEEEITRDVSGADDGE